ncbi:hypothetical protein, partial [Thermococcus sp.]|uniref:hypothetical protein n=1 Tax=Thermococcus sp. TaxID=35749 RepID=UPI002609D1A8
KTVPRRKFRRRRGSFQLIYTPPCYDTLKRLIKVQEGQHGQGINLLAFKIDPLRRKIIQKTLLGKVFWGCGGVSPPEIWKKMGLWGEAPLRGFESTER